MRLFTTMFVLIAMSLCFSGLSQGQDDREQVVKDLKQAVRAGKLTKEQATEKLASLKGAATTKKPARPAPDAVKQSDSEAIKAAVKAGKLTKEQAAEKLASLKGATTTKKPPIDKKEKRTNLDIVSDKLLELVKAGLLSKQQFTAMLEAARKLENTKVNN